MANSMSGNERRSIIKRGLYFTFSLVILLWYGLTGCAPENKTAIQTPTIHLTQTPRATLSPTLITKTPTTPPTPVATFTSEATSTPVPPKVEQQLTYVSDCHRGFYGVYAIDVFCNEIEARCFGEPQLLFEQEDRIWDVDWSPDGNHVAYISNHDLYIADWNGENPIKIEISRDGRHNFPKWSPDGRKVAFIYFSDTESYNIRVYDVTSGEITAEYKQAFMPERIYWLSGGKMAYTSNRTLYIVDISGEVLWKYPAEESMRDIEIYDFDFTTDERKIVIGGEISQAQKTTLEFVWSDIFVLDLDKNTLLNITKGKGYHSFDPIWRDTDDIFAYESEMDGDFEIYVSDPDGQNMLQITENEYEDTSPAWRSME